MKPRRSRASAIPVLLSAVLLTPGVLLSSPGTAGATPADDPPIGTLSPIAGSSAPASEKALVFNFTCPNFVYSKGERVEPSEAEEKEAEEKEEAEEEEEAEEKEKGEAAERVILGPPVIGTSKNYGVHYSTSPDVGPTGQLGTAGLGEAGEGEAEFVKGTPDQCRSELELPTQPIPATLYEGKVYWQVYRESTFGEGEVEVGPVNSVTVYPHVEEPELIFREQIFTGYLTKIGFEYEAELQGAVVQLQEWQRNAWRTVAEAPGSKEGENTFFLKPRRPGRHTFRPLVLGDALPLGLEPVARVVREPTARRVTSAADDGSYVASNEKEAKESPIELSVFGGGSELRGLKLEVEATCAGPTRSQNVTIEVSSALRNARIAPDGTVFGVTASKGPEVWTVTLAGTLFQGRFQGKLSTSHANCEGSRTIDAVLKRSDRGST